MLQEQVVSLNFGQGLETKSDSKLVIEGKLTDLQNGVFTKAKQIAKRNGYDAMTLNIVGGGTLTSPTMAKSYKGELVCAATATGASVSGQRLFAYSSALSQWTDRGKYVSASVKQIPVSSFIPAGLSEPYSLTAAGTVGSNFAVSGNIGLVVYTSYLTSATSNVYYSLVDIKTGTKIVSDQLVSSNASKAKAVLLGGTNLAVFYFGVNGLCVRMITPTSATPVGSEVVIAATSGTPSYDVIGTPSGCALSYWIGSGTNLVVDSFGSTISSGTPTHTITIASAGTPVLISLAPDASNNVWVYWADTTAGITGINYAVVSSTMASVLGKTVVVGLGSSNPVDQLVAITSLSSPTTQNVYYSNFDGAQTADIVYNTATITGTVTASINQLNNLTIYSKPVSCNGTQYIAVMFTATLQPTGFLIDLKDYVAVAKFFQDEAEGIKYSGITNGIRQPGYVGSFYAPNATQLILCCGKVQELVPQENASNSSGIAQQTPLAVAFSSSLVKFDFNDIDAYQGVIQQDTLALNGGIVSQYDGARVTELGFSTNPDNITLSVSTGGAGNIGVGSYTYYVTYEWVDANGNLHQSAPSQPYLVTPAAGSSTITVSVPYLTLTQKNNVSICVYRTQSGGSVAYKVGTTANNPLGTGVGVQDVYADASLPNLPQLYTKGSAILDNIAPPPAMIMWSKNNRLWCVDSLNPETTIEYSKSASQGTGISFSTGLLEYLVDSSGGSITGAGSLDEKTIVIKENGLGYFIGDGATDAGVGSSLTAFQFIPSDSGGTNSKSLVVYPGGVLFRSSKGIYRLDRGMVLTYFGVAVDAYNSQDIRSALIVDGVNQIRFLTSSGSSLIYDYVMDQWGTFTNHQGYSADVWNGVYIYVRTDGNIYKENASTYLDAGSAYQLSMKTAWIKATQIQGFQRVRRISFLGDFQGTSGHGVQVSAAYDWSTSFASPVSYSFSGSNGAFQYRERLPQQKCNSFQLQIQEVTTGASGEFIDLSDMGLEIGAKRGLNKLASTASVG